MGQLPTLRATPRNSMSGIYLTWGGKTSAYLLGISPATIRGSSTLWKRFRILTISYAQFKKGCFDNDTADATAVGSFAPNLLRNIVRRGKQHTNQT
jgi:hypothetical protein